MESSKEKLQIRVYTDGACSGNPGTGGWAALILMSSRFGREKIVIKGGEVHTTNNRMEMTAVVEALKFIAKNTLTMFEPTVVIYSDSAYITDNINKGSVAKWERNGWVTTKNTPVLNQDLWKYMISFSRHIGSASFVKVKGHSTDKYNNYVDKVAVKERDKFKTLLSGILP